MGQNSSTAFQRSSQPLFPRRKSKAAQTPPMNTREVSNTREEVSNTREEVSTPTTPSYAVAENKVLPNGLQDMNVARKLLRPVSQELTKFHPEYADIFQKIQADDNSSMDASSNANGADKWRSDQSLDMINNSMQINRISNGTNHTRKASNSSMNDVRLYRNESISSSLMSDPVSITRDDRSTSNPEVHSKLSSASNLIRSQSMEMELPVNIPKHKRHTSLASGSSVQDNVILEDPREHLYNAARSMPFSNYQPSTTSLPVKSTFDIDYSMNLTYAQLTEFRRNKRASLLGERAGTRMEELEAEISASSTLPKSPFDRQNLGGKSSTHSISTGSSDTGVSKSKKKRAPEPPKLQPSIRQRNQEFHGNSEPIPAFDINARSLVNDQNRGKSLQRSVSSASKNSKHPAPQPLPPRMSLSILQGSASAVTQSATVSSSNNLSMTSATLPRSSSNKSQSDVASKETSAYVTSISVKQSISEAKAQLDALQKLKDILLRVEPPETATLENEIIKAPPGFTDDAVNETINVVDLEVICDDNGNTLDKGITLGTVNPIELNQTEVNQTEGNQIDNLTKVYKQTENQAELHLKEEPQVHVRQPELHLTEIRQQEAHLTEIRQQEAHLTEIRQQEAHQAEIRQQEAHLTEIRQQEAHQAEIRQQEAHLTEIRQQDRHHTEVNQTLIMATGHQSNPEIHIKDVVVSSNAGAPLKKMSSMLQHDIILAAQARTIKADNEESGSSVEYYKSTPEVIKENILKDIIVKEDTQMDISKIRNSERNTDSLSVSKSPDDKHTIFQSDFFSSIKKSTRSNSEASTAYSIQTENEVMKAEDLKPLSPFWKYEKRMHGDEIDQEDMSSAASVDASIRSSNQSEDMSISSSNASQRVFSPDWAPEHDLDPDDDIMDDGCAETERKISSEGFKPSIIPPKISSLKESQANRNSKKNKKNERTENGFPSENEKSKFGSIRKFKKSVHRSMKNAFGSISKASGALLNKQKSQEYLDSKERKSQTTTEESEDDVLESFRNLNWALSSSRNGSLRRAVSDGFVNEQNVNRNDESELFENSDNEVGDIDFADGINDIPVPQKTAKQIAQGGQNTKVLKRPGVAYVGGKGQIVILPEYHTVHVDEAGQVINDSQGNEGHAPKTHKTKEKKYTYESTLRKQEKYKIEEALARMISEKEHQYETERLRQKEIESNFRRLRNLEIQERKQRQQKDNIQEQIIHLQNEQLVMQAQNELNNNASGVSSVNNLGVVPNGQGINTSYTTVDMLPLSSSYTFNSNPSILQPGYFNSTINIGNTLPTGHQPAYNLPVSHTSALVQPMSQTVVPNILTNSVNLSHLPASFMGLSSISGVQSSMVSPNLTQQELAYLSDYMWKMGVPPPITQHQWAALLNSVAYNSSDFPVLGQTHGAFPVTESGPDLSYIFGSQKTLNTRVTDMAMEALDTSSNQQAFQSLGNTSVQRHNAEDTIYNLLPLQNSNREQSLLQQQLPHTITPKHDFGIVNYTTTSAQPTQEASSTINPITNITIAGGASATDHNHQSLTEVKTYNSTLKNIETKGEKEIVSTENLIGDDKTVSQNTARSLPAKVYGPIGFRPVSFKVGSPR